MLVINKVNHLFEKEEKNAFGIMTLAITAGSCLAGVAAMYILQTGAPTWQLGLVAASAMGSNAMAIAQAGFKTFMWSFLISTLVSALFIVINIV